MKRAINGQTCSTLHSRRRQIERHLSVNTRILAKYLKMPKNNIRILVKYFKTPKIKISKLGRLSHLRFMVFIVVDWIVIDAINKICK